MVRGNPFDAGWPPLASVVLHALLLFVGWWLPGHFHSPTRLSPDPVVPVVFSPMPEFVVPPLPPESGPPQARLGRPEGRADRFGLRPPGPVAAPPPQAVPKPLPNASSSPPARPALDASAAATTPRGSRPSSDPVDVAQVTPDHSIPRPASPGFRVDRALRDFRSSLSRSAGEGAPVEGGGGESGRGSLEGLNIPDLPPLPDTGFGFGNLEFESRDYDWSDYARQIYVAIWRAWHNRLYLTTDAFEKWGYQNTIPLLDHQNRIRFRIESNGEVTGVVLETPSGCVPLDESATDALREVVLPRLPPDFPRAEEMIHARFIAYGEIRALRPSLQYLRSRGFF